MNLDLGNQFIFVDPVKIHPETLAELAKEFVLREQANDGSLDFDLDRAVARALASIKRGDYLITFDSETESVGVIDKADPALAKTQTTPS